MSSGQCEGSRRLACGGTLEHERVLPFKPVDGFNDLIVWQNKMDLVAAAYLLSSKLPKDETCGLVAQIRRAADCVPSSIELPTASWPSGVPSFSVGPLAEMENSRSRWDFGIWPNRT